MNCFFITAVGTSIGKTLITTILSHQLRSQSRQVIALKPIVSGFTPGDPESDPALILQSLDQPITFESVAAISPWRFSAPLSPHLAARREARPFNLAEVLAFCRQHEDPAATLLVEGAGGVMSPLTDNATNLDLITELAYPVILVTGSYLGSISHTLTAHQTLTNKGARVHTIIVSESNPTTCLTDTVETLQSFTANHHHILPLPRLSGSPNQKWTSAPNLIDTIISTNVE